MSPRGRLLTRNLGPTAALLCVLAQASGCGGGDLATQTAPASANFSLVRRQALSIASNPTLAGVQALTLTAWIKLTTKAANEVIAAKDNDATKEGSEYWLGYEKSSDRLNFQVEDPTDGTKFVKANTFGSPPIDEWLFVVGFYDPEAQTVNIQIDDGLIDQAPAGTSTRLTDTPFSIGSDARVGSFFDGQISSVGFFRRVLTASERTDLYNSSLAPYGLIYDQLSTALQKESTATFVSWWNLTEPNGTRYDSRSTRNDLTPRTSTSRLGKPSSQQTAAATP